VVFPIYNEQSQIVGFSGRKINDNNEAPKWKHVGVKTKWIYPAFLPQEKTVDKIIEEKREVVLVESIGDSLALTDEGYANNLVTFGLDCSPSLLNYLCSKSLDKIIIATNNDEGKQKNHGKIAALKIYMKLSQFFNFEQLSIQLPHANDFGEMRQREMSFNDCYNNPQSPQEVKLNVYKEFCLANRSSFQDKKLNKFLKKIEDYE
jgi:DNA primase